MLDLYVVDKFALVTRQLGSPWMGMGLMLNLALSLSTNPLTKKFGELTLIRVGLVSGALGFVLVTQAMDYLTTLLALGLFIYDQAELFRILLKIRDLGLELVAVMPIY